MPVGFQRMIYNDDLRRNPEWLYVFGDNVARRGRGGQAAEMRGEPNAVGIVTKYAPGMFPGDFFSNSPEQVLAQNRMIDNDMKPLFKHVLGGGIVIWPSAGIGTERAQLGIRSPLTFDYIGQKLAALIRVGYLCERSDLRAVALAQEHGT